MEMGKRLARRLGGRLSIRTERGKQRIVNELEIPLRPTWENLRLVPEEELATLPDRTEVAWNFGMHAETMAIRKACKLLEAGHASRALRVCSACSLFNDAVGETYLGHSEGGISIPADPDVDPMAQRAIDPIVSGSLSFNRSEGRSPSNVTTKLASAGGTTDPTSQPEGDNNRTAVRLYQEFSSSGRQNSASQSMHKKRNEKSQMVLEALKALGPMMSPSQRHGTLYQTASPPTVVDPSEFDAHEAMELLEPRLMRALLHHLRSLSG